MKKEKKIKPLKCACCGGENFDITLVGDEYGYTHKELLCRECDFVTVIDKNGEVVKYINSTTSSRLADTKQVRSENTYPGFKGGKIPASAIISDDFVAALNNCFDALRKCSEVLEKLLEVAQEKQDL